MLGKPSRRFSTDGGEAKRVAPVSSGAAVAGTTRALQNEVQPLAERGERRERETSTMKATAARLEAQRRRANDIRKSDGKSASLARQLDFVENQLAQLHTCRDTLIGLLLVEERNRQ